MADHAVLREVTLTLPMVADMEIAASKTATAMAEFMGLTADKADEVRMAVVEACINSFEHSHADDSRVYLTFAVIGDELPEKLEITVRDTGQGFEPSEVLEPKIEEKIRAERKRGWGLKIIRGLMDDVAIESDAEGTTITMVKYRQAGERKMTETLKVTLKKRGDLPVIYTEGYINNEGGEEIAKIAYRLLDEGEKKLLLNLEKTKIVNSIGISILIEIIERILEIDGKLGFCCLTKTIAKTFHIMGLAQYAEIYDDEAGGLAGMTG